MSKATLKRGTLLFVGALTIVALLQFVIDRTTTHHSQSLPWQPQHGSLAAANWFNVEDPLLAGHDIILGVQEVPSIRSGLSTLYLYNNITRQPGVPFVVRHAREWAHVSEDNLFRVLNESSQILQSIEYPGPRKQIEVEMTARYALGKWLQNGSISVVASPMKSLLDLVPKLLIEDNKADLDASGPSMLLSNGRSFTPLHVDDIGSGGGWAWLAEGEKHWVLLSPAWAEHLPTTRFDFKMPTEHGRGSLRKLADLAKALPHVKLGPIYVAKAAAGDFICWPPGYLHGVVTTEKAIGVAGYLRLDSDDQAIDSLPPVLRFGLEHKHVPWDDTP